MKKVTTLIIVTAAALAGWHYAQNDEIQLSDLALENVEALARNEGGGGYCSKPGEGCIIKFSDGSSTFISGRWN